MTYPADQWNLTLAPLTAVENDANPSCPFSTQVSISNSGGYVATLTTFYAGTVNLSKRSADIGNLPRLQAWGVLQGTLCLNATPPASEYIYALLDNGSVQQNQLNFVKATAAPGTLAVSPASVSLTAIDPSQSPQATINVNLSDKSQAWTATVYPLNRTAGWLSASQLSGVGPGTITLTASGFGYAPGAYRAMVTIQSPNSTPQFVTIPVMFVLAPIPA